MMGRKESYHLAAAGGCGDERIELVIKPDAGGFQVSRMQAQPWRSAESRTGTLMRVGHPSAYAIESQANDGATTRLSNPVTARLTDSSPR